MHGQFVWYELMTSDPKSALRFYPSVTGWGTEEWDQSQYTMWTADGVPLGGVVQLRPDQTAQGLKAQWLPYIEVNDVDVSATQGRSLGARLISGPQDIPGTGRFAVMADPQGAVFAIYKPIDVSNGFDGTRHLGRFVWHELMSTDYEAAFAFYQTMFRWEKTSALDMGPIGMYQMFGQRGKEYGGMFNRGAEQGQMPPFWGCYAHVKDVKKAADIATRQGAKPMVGPMEVPGGDWIAMMMDPQGAIFAIHQEPIATQSVKATVKAKGKAKSKPKSRTKSKPKSRTKSKPKSRTKSRTKLRTSSRTTLRTKSRKKATATKKRKRR